MAYIGKSPVIGNFVKLDAITAVNGQAAYTMQNGGSNFTDYESVNQFLVSLNGTIQAPTDSFTVSGSTLTFASNLATGDVIDFIMVFGNSLSAGTPTDATVSTAKIVDDAVTAAKINNDIISGSTELASEPADTDEFLVSDAGTLKRIDYSLIKGGGRFTLVSTTTIPGGATYIDMDDVFSATYKNYLLVYTGVDVNTDGEDLHIQVKTSGGLVSGGSDYVYGYAQIASNNTISSANSTGASYYRLNNNGIGNQATESVSGTVVFYEPRSTSHYHLMEGHQVSLSTGVDSLSNWSVGAAKTTTALTGLRLKTASGNLDAGVLKLYGAND